MVQRALDCIFETTRAGNTILVLPR